MLTRQYGQLLIIYLTTLFISGGASLAIGRLATGMTLKDLAKQIKLHVSDPARQQSSKAVLKQWKAEGNALKKEYKEQRETLLDLIKNHGATKSEYDTVINDILTKDQQYSERFLDIQFELRKHIEADEWKNIFASG